MNILKRIFGDDKERDKIVTGAISGIDKIFFTAEERADANTKVSEWYLKYLEATQPQNLARRLIAIAVTGLWCFMLLLSVAIYPFNDEWSRIAFTALDEIVNTPFGIIIGFYFLTHAMRSYKKEAKQ